MPQDRTRKIVVAGILGAIAIFLGITKWGFLPWFTGTSITILTVPVVIGAVLEGPVVGLAIGLIFGVFSLIQAAVAPNGPGDVIFTNPLISVLPRLFIGPAAWAVWEGLKRWQVVGLLVLVGAVPFAAAATVFVGNSLAEAAVCAILTLVIVAAWKQIQLGRKKGSNLE
jgi:uncharacterized membrane protein